MALPLQLDDPAYWMLEEGRKNPNWRSKPNLDIYRDSCYICTDPEFALMGLPLCYPCPACGGHTPADDTMCENGHDTYEEGADDGTRNAGIGLRVPGQGGVSGPA
jgi:hypothetical protein